MEPNNLDGAERNVKMVLNRNILKPCYVAVREIEMSCIRVQLPVFIRRTECWVHLLETMFSGERKVTDS
jgi:hypothetical protein